MPDPIMPATTAAWIRDVVLPAGYLAAEGPTDRCPCQYGPSGTCARGRHDQCVRTVGWDRHGQPWPETHIAVRSGRTWVVTAATAAVWRTGPACRWLCPCDCHTTVQALIQPPPRQAPRRASVCGGNHATGRSPDPDQLTLWEMRHPDT